jgi:hypothetical protein
MGNPVGYQGRGTQIAFATTAGGSVNSAYTPMAQLEKFSKGSTKVDMDDITCLDSPGTNAFPFPTLVDNGKWQGEGVYDAQNPTITAMQSYFQSMALLGYKVTLTDGTTFVGLCYISNFEAPTVEVRKANRYKFEVSVFGIETLTPEGGSAISE